MPLPPEPQKPASRGTYAVGDNEKELARLTIQDRIITAAMGGVLPEQSNPGSLRRMLDVACGTGGWLIQAAQIYPETSLVGIDISSRMIEYARSQAQAHQVQDWVSFHVRDVLLTLEFPANYFDLVNLRFGFSFLRTWDWPKMLGELLRVTRPKGVVRVTESQIIPQSNSPALTQLYEMAQCALFRAGHLFTQESAGLTSHLAPLLGQHGCQQVQTKAHMIEYRAGTAEGEAYSEDMRLLFQTLRPFLKKWGCASENYETIYQQAFREVHHPDFHVTVNLLTAWGNR